MKSVIGCAIVQRFRKCFCVHSHEYGFLLDGSDIEPKVIEVVENFQRLIATVCHFREVSAVKRPDGDTCIGAAELNGFIRESEESRDIWRSRPVQDR